MDGEPEGDRDWMDAKFGLTSAPVEMRRVERPVLGSLLLNGLPPEPEPFALASTRSFEDGPRVAADVMWLPANDTALWGLMDRGDVSWDADLVDLVRQPGVQALMVVTAQGNSGQWTDPVTVRLPVERPWVPPAARQGNVEGEWVLIGDQPLTGAMQMVQRWRVDEQWVHQWWSADGQGGWLEPDPDAPVLAPAARVMEHSVPVLVPIEGIVAFFGSIGGLLFLLRLRRRRSALQQLAATRSRRGG